MRFTMKLKSAYSIMAVIILSAFTLIAATNPEKGVTNNQVATLSGTVTDGTTGEAIQDATVTLSETGESTRTDENGSFNFSNVEPGSYSISAKASGYQTAEETVEVSEEGGPVQISLEPEG